MPLQKIYIARHGFRLNWVSTDWTSATGLPRDPPLAAFGETQAQELADYFLTLPEDERPTAIFSSPFYRCLQTSQPTARALALPIYVEHGTYSELMAHTTHLTATNVGIAEWYSPVVPGTGLHPRPAPASLLKSHFPEIDPSWSSIYYPSQRGEDVPEVHDRTDDLVRNLLPHLEHTYEGKHKVVLLVSHAATVITLARSLLGDRNLPLRVGCCSLSEFVPKDPVNSSDGSKVIGGWQANKLADGSHMKQGSLRDWGFEDIEIAAGKVVEDPGVPGTERDQEGPTGVQVTYTSLL